MNIMVLSWAGSTKKTFLVFGSVDSLDQMALKKAKMRLNVTISEYIAKRGMVLQFTGNDGGDSGQEWILAGKAENVDTSHKNGETKFYLNNSLMSISVEYQEPAISFDRVFSVLPEKTVKFELDCKTLEKTLDVELEKAFLKELDKLRDQEIKNRFPGGAPGEITGKVLILTIPKISLKGKKIKYENKVKIKID